MRWEIPEPVLLELFAPNTLKRVTDGYYTTSCKSLGGLNHKLGFHFEPRTDGRLAYLEFFRERYDDLADSFDEFQRHLENVYGKPTVRLPSRVGFPALRWAIGKIEIWHYALDRFGPEEHVTIRCDGRVDPYWDAATR